MIWFLRCSIQLGWSKMVEILRPTEFFLEFLIEKKKTFPNEEIMKRVDFSIFSSWYKQRTPQIGMNPTCINFLMLGQKWPQRFRLSKFGLSLKRPFRAFSCLSWDFVWISLSVLVLGEKTLECCLEWVYSENTLKIHEKDWKRFNQGCSRIHEQYII